VKGKRREGGIMSAPDALIEGIAGAIGGSAALIATYPLMTVRLHTC